MNQKSASLFRGKKQEKKFRQGPKKYFLNCLCFAKTIQLDLFKFLNKNAKSVNHESKVCITLQRKKTEKKFRQGPKKYFFVTMQIKDTQYGLGFDNAS